MSACGFDEIRTVMEGMVARMEEIGEPGDDPEPAEVWMLDQGLDADGVREAARCATAGTLDEVEAMATWIAGFTLGWAAARIREPK